MTFSTYLSQLLVFAENDANLNKEVVFVDPHEGDVQVTGICLRKWNFDPSGPEVIELS